MITTAQDQSGDDYQRFSRDLPVEILTDPKYQREGVCLYNDLYQNGLIGRKELFDELAARASEQLDVATLKVAREYGADTREAVREAWNVVRSCCKGTAKLDISTQKLQSKIVELLKDARFREEYSNYIQSGAFGPGFHELEIAPDPKVTEVLKGLPSTIDIEGELWVKVLHSNFQLIPEHWVEHVNVNQRTGDIQFVNDFIPREAPPGWSERFQANLSHRHGIEVSVRNLNDEQLDALPGEVIQDEEYQKLGETLYRDYFKAGFIGVQEYVDELALLSARTLNFEGVRTLIMHGATPDIVLPGLWQKIYELEPAPREGRQYELTERLLKDDVLCLDVVADVHQGVYGHISYRSDPNSPGAFWDIYWHLSPQTYSEGFPTLEIPDPHAGQQCMEFLELKGLLELSIDAPEIEALFGSSHSKVSDISTRIQKKKSESEAFQELQERMFELASYLGSTASECSAQFATLLENTIAEQAAKKIPWKAYLDALGSGTPLRYLRDITDEFETLVFIPYMEAVGRDLESNPISKGEVFETLFWEKSLLEIQRFNRAWHNPHRHLSTDILEVISASAWYPVLGHIIHPLDEHHSFQELSWFQALVEEGEKMNNCLAKFAAACTNGKIAAFKIIDRKANGREGIATLTVHTTSLPTGEQSFSLHDLTLPGNQPPTEEISNAANRFIEYLNREKAEREEHFSYHETKYSTIGARSLTEGYERTHGVPKGRMPWRAMEYYKSDLFAWKKGRNQKDNLGFMERLSQYSFDDVLSSDDGRDSWKGFKGD